MVAGICAGVLAAAVLAVGGGDGAGGDGAGGYSMRTDARFAPPGAFVPSAALTYDQELVPAAAWIEVEQRMSAGGATSVRLRVSGLKPGHAYGVHVHRNPCGADPAASGGHYQHVVSSEAHHVNAENEVWLDFTTDERGAGRARAEHSWGFRKGEAASVVLHDRPGSRERAGCFTVPFGWVA